jgi:hypothetical protein
MRPLNRHADPVFQQLNISGHLKQTSDLFPVPVEFIIGWRLSYFNLALNNSAVELIINKFINSHELVAPMTI